ncbi:MAG: response regulator [Nitrospinae bacterium]|nr:response regulator [Nitrospinota bacterium]MZH15119.1 response regulator [Nitrospinota bacterium]
MDNKNNLKKVLIIDDAVVVREVIRRYLLEMGFNNDGIFEAENGSKGLDLLQKEKIDLIISDWNMPQMSGLELLNMIKEYNILKNIPFIMVTSENEKEKVDEAFKAGVSQYIFKPFKPKHFKEKIQQTLEKNLYGAKQVMVVDDSMVIRKIIERQLRQLGFGDFNFINADNGRNALTCLEEQPIDLIITDLHMPEMDGIEFIQEVRNNDRTDYIPVLMVTSDYDPEKMLEAYQAGTDEFMQKPFKVVELEEKIKTLFDQ